MWANPKKKKANRMIHSKFSASIVARLRSCYAEETAMTGEGEGFVVPNARRFLIRAGRKNIPYGKQKELFTHYEWSFDELMDIVQNPVNNFVIYEDDHPFEHLCQCIEMGRIDEAMELTKTVDYTMHDSHVIFLAARYGHVAFMKFLFELPRIDILTENALIPACEFGHFECVRMLWERGLDPSRDLCLGVRLAVQNGYLDIVKYLLEDKRIDITCRNNYAVKKAAEGNHYEMLQYLLVERGLDPTVNDNHLLLIACINNNEKMVRMLYAMPGVRLPLGKIQIFGKTGNLKLLNILLADPRIRLTRDSLLSALYLSISKGHMDVMKVFLQLLGHDEPIPDRAISLACSNGQLDAFNLLINDERIQLTQFKLISASMCPNEDTSLVIMKKLLLLDKEKIHANQDCGLSKVIKLGHQHKLHVLLTKTPAEAPRFVKKALVTAIKMETLEMVQMICQEHERDPSLVSLYPILVAAEIGYAPIFSYLVNLVDFDLTEHNNECFVLALKRGQHDIIRIITRNRFFLAHLEDRRVQRAAQLELRAREAKLAEESSEKTEVLVNTNGSETTVIGDGAVVSNLVAGEGGNAFLPSHGDIFPTFEDENIGPIPTFMPTAFLDPDVNLLQELSEPGPSEIKEPKDDIITELLDNYAPTKFNFLNPSFIETFEIALPFIDESLMMREMKVILQKAFSKNGYDFIAYLLGKWPCYKEEYFSNLTFYNEKLHSPEEMKSFLVKLMWPVMRLIYLMAGEEEDTLLKEVCLSIMCVLLFYLSQ